MVVTVTLRLGMRVCLSKGKLTLLQRGLLLLVL